MFGGGSGHIFEMIAKLKANDALRKKKHYFKIKKDKLENELYNQHDTTITNVDEHRKIGLYLQTKDASEMKNQLIFLFILLTIVLIIGTIIAWFYI